ncbi:hypothetical protein FIU87_17385 [Bacillus sp. THAF10]|nr:hypothetical protein FIU87_17385 [Bacillus sp. THAF10]
MKRLTGEPTGEAEDAEPLSRKQQRSLTEQNKKAFHLRFIADEMPFSYSRRFSN